MNKLQWHGLRVIMDCKKGISYALGKSDSVRLFINKGTKEYQVWIYPTDNSDIEEFTFPCLDSAIAAMQVFNSYYDNVVLVNFKMF